MAALQEYKCPCCGGAIAFDSTLQKMKCPFCDTEFEMETLASYDNELKNEPEENMSWDDTAGTEWENGEASGGYQRYVIIEFSTLTCIRTILNLDKFANQYSN